jgi:hypothetical protein
MFTLKWTPNEVIELAQTFEAQESKSCFTALSRSEAMEQESRWLRAGWSGENAARTPCREGPLLI